MCDVFSRLFHDSTQPRSEKLHRFYEDDKRRETEKIQILQENHKLSVKPLVLEENNPFDIQDTNLFRVSNRIQNQTENKTIQQSLSKSLNRKEGELITSNLNFMKSQKKAKDNFHTPRKEVQTSLIDSQLKYSLNKTLNNSILSSISKQNNLAKTMPRPQPQLQIRHLEVNSAENTNHPNSRSQKNSARIRVPSSSLSSRSLNKMKIKMKNGRFISKREVDNDFSCTEDEKISPQKFKKQITQLENTINENREKMRLGLGDENENNKNVQKDKKKHNNDQITPKLRKTSKSMTPNLVQIKTVNQTPKSLFPNIKNKNIEINPKIDLSLDLVNPVLARSLNLNLDDHSISDEKFDLYEDLDSRLNSTLSKNLKNKADLNEDSSLCESIDFDDYFKKGKKSQFGSQFDFLFGEDEMIQHKNLNKGDKDADKELIMIDPYFWNLHMSNMIPTETDNQDELPNENADSSSPINSEDSPIIQETSLNSPMEQKASTAHSTTLFSWELAGFTNPLSDMQI